MLEPSIILKNSAISTGCPSNKVGLPTIAVYKENLDNFLFPISLYILRKNLYAVVFLESLLQLLYSHRYIRNQYRRNYQRLTMNVINLNPATLTTRDKWHRPTTDEVELLWNIASWMYGIPIYKLHTNLCIGERAARRWRSKANARENNKSIIKYTNWALLVALVTGKSIVQKTSQQIVVAPELIYKSTNYISPPADRVKQFIGKRSLTGLSRADLAEILGVSSDLLSKSVANMPFHLWAGILMHLNVPVRHFFSDLVIVNEIKGKVTDFKYSESELLEAHQLVKHLIS